MAMIGHVEFGEVFTKMAKEFWFPKPLGRVSVACKALNKLVVEITTATGGLIKRQFSAVLFDEYMNKYMVLIVDEMNTQLASSKPLAQSLPSAAAADVNAGKTSWQKDSFGIDPELEEMRSALSDGASGTLKWLASVAQQYALYFLSVLLETEMKAGISKKITAAKAANEVLVFHDLVK